MSKCEVFGQCGGCSYQDIPYTDELRIKEERVRSALDVDEEFFSPIIPSPKMYHYRHRLDLKMIQTKEGKQLMGFSPLKDYSFGIVDIQTCPIAMEAVSENLINIRSQAFAKMGQKYRRANLVVRTGDDRRVDWGGIGKGSLKRTSDQYLWTQVGTKKIYYSMDTFFQANLSILPALFEKLQRYSFWGPETCLYDLYGGVGLFGVGLADEVGQVILVEENKASVACARYNQMENLISHMSIYSGRMEDVWQDVEAGEFLQHVAIIDPPRDGLSQDMALTLAGNQRFDHFLYLSCYPEALARDLEIFKSYDWAIQEVTPFDFFPQTKHIETLVWLKKKMHA